MTEWFYDLVRGETMQTFSDLDSEEIAESLYRAYYYALGAESPSWDEASERDLLIFNFAGQQARPFIKLLEGSPDQSIRHAADELQRIINEAMGARTYKPIETLSPENQLAIEAMVRHMNFLVESNEAREKMIEMERSWRPWVAKKLAQMQGVT